MQVARARRRAAAVLAALSILMLAWSAVAAQESDVRRFFGFHGDITIDGEPLEPGSTIVALVGDELVGEAVVNAAGAWILDIDTQVFEGGDCQLTFVVNDLWAESAWESCTMRVRLALISPEGQSETDSEPAADERAAQDEGALVQSDTLVRPDAPLTGSGGILDEVGVSAWTRTAAVTAALTLLAALAALLISRRSDGPA